MAGVIAAVVFFGILANPDFRDAIIAIAVIYVLGLLAFFFWIRHHLILSQEEEYAMSGVSHGVITSLPTCRRACSAACAAWTAVSEYLSATSGRTSPRTATSTSWAN